MKIALPLMLGGLLFACSHPEKPNLDAAREKILVLHHQQRDFHFQGDSIGFVNQLSEDFISVNRGIISQPTKAETQARYHGYFSVVEFEKWDDVSEPIIRFSEDGKLAYTIVDKIVQVSYEIEGDSLIVDSTHFAWTAIYRKQGEEWKIECVTSTERPRD